MTVTDDDFVSLGASQLTLPRKSNGSLLYKENNIYSFGKEDFQLGGKQAGY